MCLKLRYTHILIHICTYTHTDMTAHLENNAYLSRENLRELPRRSRGYDFTFQFKGHEFDSLSGN